MKRTPLLIVGVALAAVGAYAFFNRGDGGEQEIEYRFQKTERGDLIRSISATGQVVALTKVDVKSKAGGKVVRLLVDEGSIVKQGDLIAMIDPSDTQASYEQANADLESANARTTQAQENLTLEGKNIETAIDNGRANLETMRIRLNRTQIEARRQPDLSSAAVRTAQASYQSALAALDRLKKVDIPNQRKAADTDVENSKTALSLAQDNLARQRSLLEKGYVSQITVDQAQNTLASAQRAYANAIQTQSTMNDAVNAQVRAATLEVDRTKSALDQATTNRTQDQVAKTELSEAQKAVRAAEIQLQQALDARTQVNIRQAEVQAAKASTVRSRVAVDNAKVQLDSTTVVAPRAGVVTTKYLEEGTIIPPGTSTFSEGTSLVEISDVTQLFVECAVDEADIGSVKVGQRVRIVTEAFPGVYFDGKVTRVNPAAVTTNNITAVKVRVQVLPGVKVQVMPGMNATCEFITMEKPGVLIVPAQAIKEEGGKKYVMVKTAEGKLPERREVEVGETGNDGVQILKGLKEGEEVVTAEINLEELREIQKKMSEAEEGGALAGGGKQKVRPRANTTGGGQRK